jgi:hypothetical protein
MGLQHVLGLSVAERANNTILKTKKKERRYCHTLQALTHVWWQNIQKNIEHSETLFS